MISPACRHALEAALQLKSEHGAHITAITMGQPMIEKTCPDFDLILCGCYTSDSETAQVGPQLAEELDVPGVAYVEDIDQLFETFDDKISGAMGKDLKTHDHDEEE